jgi:26S proteasome regulatory subunit N1
LSDKDVAQRENALQQINNEIKGATKTMTSVPKPLKFLSPLYENMLKAYETQTGDLKERYAETLSVVGMVAGEDDESHDALKYCLLGTRRSLVSWGHEYLRCLAGQIGD